jgi:HPr kinase/phosphorylase
MVPGAGGNGRVAGPFLPPGGSSRVPFGARRAFIGATLKGREATAPMQIPISRLLLDQADALDLEVLAGESGLNRLVTTPELHRPGLALAGFLDVFTHDRIQVLGNTETLYLMTLPPEERLARLDRVFSFQVPCAILTNDNEAPAELVEVANARKVPLLRSAAPTAQLYSVLGFYLERQFAPSVTAHGVFVDVFGIGVLIMGSSGIGKSEIALELIERGHRLVADDVVLLRKIGKYTLMGGPLNEMQHHMEVRGLGVVDVEMLFGYGSVREEMALNLVVELVKRGTPGTEDLEERFRDRQSRKSFLEVEVHHYKIPVEPGRNTSIVIEVAALQHRILSRGHDPQKALNDQLIRQMTKRGNLVP